MTFRISFFPTVCQVVTILRGENKTWNRANKTKVYRVTWLTRNDFTRCLLANDQFHKICNRELSSYKSSQASVLPAFGRSWVCKAEVLDVYKALRVVLVRVCSLKSLILSSFIVFDFEIFAMNINFPLFWDNIRKSLIHEFYDNILGFSISVNLSHVFSIVLPSFYRRFTC